MSIDKYVGRMVRIIYMDEKQRFSERTVRIVRVAGNTVRVFDFGKGEPRSFRADGILAWVPVVLHAS